MKDVVSLTGTPGLHKIIKSDDKAIVVESLDERKHRQLIKGNMMVSKVADISIYTEEESEPLVKVFKAIEEKYGKELPVAKKSTNEELMGFLAEVLPTFDRERVYPSNVKKLVGWYNILTAYDVAFEWEEESGEEETASDEETAEDAAVSEAGKEDPQA